MRRFAVLCPGQGGQSPTMFDLAASDPVGRAAMDACSGAVGVDLAARARADHDLFENAFAQPAIVAAALATWAALAPRLPPPALFAGYSVGELAAWGCAGAWDAAATATLAARRARAMDDHTPPGCGMLAVRGLREAVLAPLTDGLQVAIVNAGDHVVLAGPDAALHAAQARLAACGASTRRLDVRVPSHTAILREATVDFAAILAATPPHAVSVPVLRGIDGQPCSRPGDAVGALAQAVSRTVRWDRCMDQLAESGIDVALELAPGDALTRIAADRGLPVTVRSVADFRSIAGVVQWLQRQLDG